VLGATGCLLVAIAPDAIVALAGFLLIGLGVSVVVPLVFAAAGRSGPSPAIAVAGVATVSYGAGMAAPSVMGGVADVSSLRIAFAISALLAASMIAGARLLRQQPETESAAAAAASSGPAAAGHTGAVTTGQDS
jgi:MFS family permease